MLKVAAYTGGRRDPSARFRVRQFIPLLGKRGIEVHEQPAVFGAYPPAAQVMRPLWAMAAIGERALSAALSYASDVTLLQRPMLSRLMTAELLTRSPRVLDVDDAIWLGRGATAVPRLARLCDLVICGNDYLAEEFRRWNPRVRVLPTAVDTELFRPSAFRSPDRILGWSGSSSGFRYLEMIAPALRAVLDRRRDVRLRIISDRRPQLDGIDDCRIEFLPWSAAREAQRIQDLTVGLMPVEDTPWGRGKCAFKMLTYMACGVPAVASPVGVNATILAGGGGLAASSFGEWVEAMGALLDDVSLARSTGEQGRETVVKGYSLEVVAPELATILTSFGGGGSEN